MPYLRKGIGIGSLKGTRPLPRENQIAWVWDAELGKTLGATATISAVTSWSEVNIVEGATDGDGWTTFTLPIDAAPAVHYIQVSPANDTQGQRTITLDAKFITRPTGATSTFLALYETGSTEYISFDLEAGTVAHVVGTAITGSITAITGGYRITITWQTAANDGGVRAYFSKAPTIANYQSLDGIGSIALKNPTIDQTQLAALASQVTQESGVPFDLRTWDRNPSSVTIPVVTAVDDYYTFALAADASAVQHMIVIRPWSWGAGASSITVDVRKGAGDLLTHARIALNSSSLVVPIGDFVHIDLTDGTFTLGGAATGSVVSIGGGWYRVTVNSVAADSGVHLSVAGSSSSTAFQAAGDEVIHWRMVSFSATRSAGGIDLANATAASQPIISPGIVVNGVTCPYIQNFSTSSESKFIQHAVGNNHRFLQDGNGSTVVYAFQFISAATANYYLILNGGIVGAGCWTVYTTAENNLRWKITDRNSTDLFTVNTVLVPNALYVMTWRFRRNRYSARVNGVEIGAGDLVDAMPTFINPPLNLSLGRTAALTPVVQAFRYSAAWKTYLNDFETRKAERTAASKLGIFIP